MESMALDNGAEQQSEGEEQDEGAGGRGGDWGGVRWRWGRWWWWVFREATYLRQILVRFAILLVLLIEGKSRNMVPTLSILLVLYIEGQSRIAISVTDRVRSRSRWWFHPDFLTLPKDQSKKMAFLKMYISHNTASYMLEAVKKINCSLFTFFRITLSHHFTKCSCRHIDTIGKHCPHWVIAHLCFCGCSCRIQKLDPFGT